MRCFVIMPFGNPAFDPNAVKRSESLFTNWIKKTVESISDPDSPGKFIQCTRADRSHTTGVVIEDIAEHLVESDIVIADLSGRNANVFYELGVRHATNVNTILISESEGDVPFDLRHLRTFFYQYEPDSMLQLQDHLRSAIAEIIRDRDRLDNPVRRYLFDRESRKLRQTSGPPGYDAMREILTELLRLRRDFSAELARIQGVVRTAAGDTPQLDLTSQQRLRALEGVWRRDDGIGLYCARMIADELFFAYSYDTGMDLDSHFYNVRVLGNALFARFAWFDTAASGIIMLTIVNNNDLSGRWWYDKDVPPDAEQNETLLRNNFASSHRIRLRRDGVNSTFPEWAEQYFANPRLRRFRGR